MENELPKKKPTRLQNFNYSTRGAYFTTICTQDRKCICTQDRKCILSTVGRGLAPAEMCETKNTIYGTIAEQQLLLLEERYSHLTIDKYVIMPNHIHVILMLDNETAGASPRPTVMDIVCAYKSLTTKECKKNGFVGKMFQTSFYEHIIRCKEDYEETVKYIYENPMRWHFDKLYTDE